MESLRDFNLVNRPESAVDSNKQFHFCFRESIEANWFLV